jgi:drug/metabolite transporter (DMT)-like permease
MTPTRQARQQVVGAALLFSTGGVAIKACSLNNWQVASFRAGIAAISLLVLVPAARRAWNRRTLLVGAAYAVTTVLFVSANKLTTAANAILLQDTAPFYLLLLGPWLLGERLRRADAGFLAAMLAGTALFFVAAEQPLVTAPDPRLGNLLAVTAAVTWALTLTGVRWLSVGAGFREGESVAAIVQGNLLACLFAGALAFPVGETAATDWLLIVHLGAGQIGLAYVLVTAAMRQLPALEVSLLLLVEPVLSTIWAWLALDETPGALAVVGGVVILLAIVLRTVRSAT